MSTPRRTQAQHPAVFTAVEGTLVDFGTLDGEASRPVALELAAEGIPLIPVTVMTLAEVAPIAEMMEMRHAMIIEACGAIVRRRNAAGEVEPCGADADALLEAVSAIETLSGADLAVYSVLPEAQAALLSGRSGSALQDSTQRCFSEPFLLEI